MMKDEYVIHSGLGIPETNEDENLDLTTKNEEAQNKEDDDLLTTSK